MIELFINKRKKITIELLYEKFENVLYNAAYAILQKQDLAENAVNDTMVEIFKSMDKISLMEEYNMERYLVAVCRNISKDIYADYFGKDYYSEEKLLSYPADDDTEEQAERKIIIEKVRDQILNMEPGYRLIIIKRFYDMKKITEIADELHISKNTVKKRLNKALLILKKALIKEGIEDEQGF